MPPLLRYTNLLRALTYLAAGILRRPALLRFSSFIINRALYPKSDLNFTKHCTEKNDTLKDITVTITMLNHMIRGSLLAQALEPENICEMKEFLTEMVVKIQVFWDMAWCRLVNRCRFFVGDCSLRLQDLKNQRKNISLFYPIGSLYSC
jgi:hypothetical protein